MTATKDQVESTIEVPEESEVTVNYTLEPTGAGEQWILRNACGEQVETLRALFQGVKAGGVGKSGTAKLIVELVNTDLTFADKQDTSDKKYDGIETYNEVDDGLRSIKKIKKGKHSAQFLEIELKAKKDAANGFSYLWVAQDADGNLVKSADPDVVVEPY